MASPNRPLPPPVEQLWKTFVTSVSVQDASRTITSLELRDVARANGLVEPLTPSLVSLSELPSVPVLVDGEKLTDPFATDFEIKGILGEGGMGRVLVARQKSLQREVALKVLKSADPQRDVINTLLTEAVITGSIEHPSIVPVHALGRDKNGQPVLVMKRIDGVSWRRIVDHPDHPLWSTLCVDQRDRLEAHLEILMSVCNAVHYAHSRGIVHRDIKPDNVMIGGFGEVYLVDWGIAIRIDNEQKNAADDAARFGPPVGTLAFMAPEMAVGDLTQIDARTDVYLLGATLHYLLTGTPRHGGDDVLDLLISARDSEPFEYGPDVPEELAAICNRAMHVEPGQRFPTALELRQALLAYRRHRGSLVLSAKAFEKLAELDAVHQVDEGRVQQAMTECRFAFMQALEIWPGNRPAREGLDRILARMVEHEIAQRHVENARALLSELVSERPDLAQKIDTLADQLAAERSNADRLHAMARNEDLRIDARFQMIIVVVLPICAVLSIFVVVSTNENHNLFMRQLITFPLTVAVALVAVFLAVRKRLTTAIARRAFILLLLYPMSFFVHRILAMTQGDSIASILTTDLVISALLAVTFGVTILSRLTMLALLFLAGAVVTTIYPDHASAIFLVIATTAATLMTVFWTQMIQAEHRVGER